MQREKILENKLAKICRLLSSTKSSLEMNWKTLIEEDRLLTHIEILERQIQASQKVHLFEFFPSPHLIISYLKYLYNFIKLVKSMNEDKLRDEVLNLQEDKEKYQNAAKEALQNALQEKMELIAKKAMLEK